jgi:hypothetical protein
MDIYKEAVINKLRFNLASGVKTVEQVGTLTKNQIAEELRELQSNMPKSDDLDFLDEKNKVDPMQELRFKILKDLYLTKKDEELKRLEEKQRKKQKEELARYILQRENEENLENLGKTPIEELKKQLAAM